jgi:hypothetical protein
MNACVLAGGWPTITLHSADGTTQIAKALPGLPSGVTSSALVSYQRPRSAAHIDFRLSRGVSASVALVTETRGPGTCHVATTATIYPGLAAVGTGKTVALARPVRFCGLPRVLSFLAGRPSASPLMPMARELSSDGVERPDGDSPTGFWYGSDTNGPNPTSSSGVYLMPDSPPAATTAATDEIGSYQNMAGCGSGLGWNSAAYNDAQSN